MLSALSDRSSWDEEQEKATVDVREVRSDEAEIEERGCIADKS